MNLELPQQQLCNTNYAGIINESNNVVDSFWASLKSLKNPFHT
ncbi:hypothetical protein RINTHH_1060 [Richelia intracellularis HH01]|uniref:Uncharacterized protein n=1 Tax=Richelia intracellularis HH01 TaxID=1165094 RepID=M1X4J6_9NOST|nr:hypothetical protein RINTHH_1060 [Richelia intracellularis HH01]